MIIPILLGEGTVLVETDSKGRGSGTDSLVPGLILSVHRRRCSDSLYPQFSVFAWPEHEDGDSSDISL